MLYQKKGLTLAFILLGIFIVVTSNVLAGFEEELFISELISRMTEKDEEIVFNYNTGYDNIDINQLKEAVRVAIGRTDNYTRYTIKDWQIRLQGSSQDVEISISVNYYNNSSEDKYVFQRVESLIDSIIRPSMNIHQKIKSITDYIAVNVEYDDYKQRYSAYDALQGRSTCQGYALFTYLMLKEAGVDNQIVVGSLDNENHAWNLVNINGKYYHLDLTQISSYYHNYNDLLYNEYLVNDAALRIKYTWNQNEYPASNASYFQQIKNDLQYTDRGLYEEMANTLNLNYMAAENTARSRTQLMNIIKGYLAEEGIKLRIRTNVGLLDKSLINNLISDIFAENPEWTNIYQGWNFSMQPIYIRDGIEDSGLLIINFEKR
ncbi:MAG: transglutaminase domain-containing protein [Halanaerobiales bacterium]